jgi:Tol biopolymer transport system component
VEELIGPLGGRVRVAIETVGEPVDPDGYALSFDEGPAAGVGVNGSHTSESLAPGSHIVSLSGVSPNCAVAGNNPRSVRVVADDTVGIAFKISCAQEVAFGTLLVSVSTTGSALDPDGYSVVADPALPLNTTLNGVALVEDLSVGDHLVRLSGVADQCSVDGENPRAVAIPPDDTARTTFVVTCWPPVSGRIAFTGWRADGSSNYDIFVVRADGTGLIDLTAGFPDFSAFRLSFSRDGRRLAFHSDDLVIHILGEDIDPATGLPSIQTVAEGFCGALSPDGQRVVYEHALPEGNGFGLFVKEVNGAGPTPIFAEPDSLSLRCPAWAPDGSRIAFTAINSKDFTGAVYLIAADGGDLTNITEGIRLVGPGDISWSPTGTQLAFSAAAPEFRTTDVFVLNLNGALANITRGRAGETFTPSWSPDGAKLVLEGDGGLFIVNADGSNLTRLTTEGERFDSDPVWAPDE